MDEPIEALPSFWRFTWMLLMQPVKLGHILVGFQVDLRASGLVLLRRHRSPADEWWLSRALQVVALSLTVDAAILSLLPSGTLLFIIATAGDLIVFGLVDLALGALLALVFVPLLLLLPSNIRWFVNMPVSFLVGLLAGGMAESLKHGIPGGYILLALPRLPLVPVESAMMAVARGWQVLTGRTTLNMTPVLYHELNPLPLPFLHNQIIAAAESNPAVTRRVLDACAIAPAQRRIGRRAEANLRARELSRLIQEHSFAAVAEIRGTWLPGVQGADPLLLAFSEAGRYLVAATSAFNPHHRLRHLDGLASQITAIENQIRAKRDSFTAPFEEPLAALRRAGEQLRTAAQQEAAGRIPNPFRVWEALSSETGSELFRGREGAVREIEETLADVARSASLQLLAPRRTGKTSLLKMLPGMLPDAICVFFDLQAHPVSSVASFWTKLSEQALNQAKLQRRVDLPPLPPGPAMEAAATWIEQLDALPDGRRVLLAIDEFERLQDLFPGNRQEFLQLMGLFRATIQHRRRVRLLVSGAAPFDELDGVWDDHFISVRQVKLAFLNEPTSIGLLTRPEAEFPSDAIPAEVAREVYNRTGGQPFLLQAFGSLLVDRLNDAKRRATEPGDARAVELKAIEYAEPYFRDMYRNAPAAVRDALDQLSQGRTPELIPAARRWLTQRYLLTADDQLAIPLFATWIAHYGIGSVVAAR